VSGGPASTSNLDVGVLTEAGGQHTARRTGPHDHIVVHSTLLTDKELKSYRALTMALTESIVAPPTTWTLPDLLDRHNSTNLLRLQFDNVYHYDPRILVLLVTKWSVV
jgi:hypothetical protein